MASLLTGDLMHHWRLLAALAVAAMLAQNAAGAHTPESPVVKRLIKSGLAYLEAPSNGALRFDDRVGGQCLLGLCFFKDSGDAKHPHVVEAIRRCQAVCRAEPKDIHLDIYSTGIAILFLCEVDAQKYTTEIEALVQSLVLRQKAHGAWGYMDGNHATTCDTSMTQYAVLGLWTAHGNGISVPERVIVAAGNWLIRTQDPNGGWGYQGNDPGEFRRVTQSPIRRSLVAAGLGSSYICADLLGVRTEQPDRGIEGLPPAFMRMPEKLDEKKPKIEAFEPKRLRQAHLDGNRWIAQNFGFVEESWLYYYMYGLERCMSFRELVEGKSPGDAWYDRGVTFLAQAQHADGHWESNAGALVDTAFAILFLMRGTKKTIQKTVGLESLDGVLIGGRGLPTDTSHVQVIGGRIIGSSLATSVDEMLTILEDPENDAFASTTEFPPELQIEATDAQERARQIERLTRLTTSGSLEVRCIAVQTLAASGRIEVAPALIAALEDREQRVSLAARDGLRRLSRKFNAFGPADDATAADKAIAAQQWRTWYDSIAP
jgi:hypothetical protein